MCLKTDQFINDNLYFAILNSNLKSMRRTCLILICVFTVTVLYGQMQKLTFTPHWLPQAQFAGYYVASEKGFYQQEGLDVEIVHPSASVMATEKLVKGESDIISLFLTSALTARDQGIDLVNVAQLSQHSGLLFVAYKDVNINKLADLNGKKIGIWESGFDEIPRALIQSNNCKVEWVPILSTINLFKERGIDALTLMWFNEYKQLLNSGINPDELTTFFFSEYSYNIPEDGLYCLSSTLKNKKPELEKFVRATLKGWEYARAHPQEAVEIVVALMKKSFVSTNLSHQKWMLEKMLEMIEPGNKNVSKGELAESDFIKTRNILFEGGYVTQKASFAEFYYPLTGN